MAAPQATEPESGLRLRLRVRGAVQGVGFRPFAYGVARRLSLGGFVRNDSEGVLIEVEGRNATQFVAALRADAPPLARIDAVDVQDVSPLGTEQFEIEAIDADEFLSRTFDLYPSEALAVLRTLRKHYNNPPFSPPEFILDLTAKGLPKLAARARQHRDFL